MPYLELDEEVREVAPEMTIGSGAQATWRIASKDLAARHFTLRLAPDGGAVIDPVTPQSVVAVNGEQVLEAGRPIHPGDVITAGSARFVYLADRGAPRPQLPAEPREAFLLDGMSGRAYRLRRRNVTIGRDAASNVVLRDPTVSRHHADMRVEAGGYVLYSTGATGTRLNNAILATPRMLRDEDQIQIGGTTFTYTTMLPTGVRPVELAGHEDAMSRRETVVDMSRVDTSEVARMTERRPIPLWTVVLALLIVLAIVLVLVF
jgi:predicted component of type VI protein secretion system